MGVAEFCDFHGKQFLPQPLCGPACLERIMPKFFFASLRLTHATSILQSIQKALSASGNKVLGPTGDVLIAPSANNLEEVEAPELAPAAGESQNQVQGADQLCCPSNTA